MTTTDSELKQLQELTSLPTAAGREDAVIAWVQRWVKRRRWATLRRDRFGNLMIAHRSGRSVAPVVLGAHMDHPGFVVEKAQGRTVTARFLGGVRESYFPGSAVRLWDSTQRGPRGVIVGYDKIDGEEDPRVEVLFSRATQARAGDVMTWDLPAASVKRGRLHAPACDNLAGVAAALVALGRWGASRKRVGDLRVLLTRAEEVGFVGAIAACGSGILPRRARVVVLENSKSFAESPIGGGPIVRVGDRTSTFDPGLTHQVTQVARAMESRDASFVWQRRLMPGGTCEATAYQAFGFTTTCVCLPLGNYHNMNETTGRIERESIAVSDFQGMVRWLHALPQALHGVTSSDGGLTQKLQDRFHQRASLLAV